MATPTFDGDNLLIILPSSEPLIDVQVDLYSDWKEWMKTSDNAKYQLAFRTEGGTPTQQGQTRGRDYFFRNDLGWRIRPAEEDADVVLEGNFFLEDSSLAWKVPTLGAFTVSLRGQFSNLSYVETVTVASSDAASEIAGFLTEDSRQATTVRSRPPGRRTS